VQHNGEYEGREIRMGVEIDGWRRPVAYWLREEPRLYQSSYAIGERFRVPASEMLHIFLPEFCAQTRGAPWLSVAMARLHQMRGIEDAELQASRASAAKFAAYEANPEFVTAPEPQHDSHGPILGADGQPLTTDRGQFAQDIAPASMEVVPWGYSLKMLDPQHPNSAIGDLLKWSARSVSTGIGVSYNTLGNDAEGVNYTSLRFFLGVEHDNWMESQDWFESEFPEPVADAWTEAARFTLTEMVKLIGEDQLHARKWQPRRWDGPDPAKQAKADTDELTIGTTTLTEIAARKGRDLDDMIAERIRELTKIREAAEAAGLTLADVLPMMAPKVAAPAPTEEVDPDDA
jgi:lambda family phage portal protein